MAHTYEELHKMTVAQLREVAEAQDSDDLKGFKSLHKAPLLEVLCKVLGVDAHVHLSEQLSRSLFPDCMNTRAWVFNWGKPYYSAIDEDDEYLSALNRKIRLAAA